jgi:hypothetical protein
MVLCKNPHIRRPRLVLEEANMKANWHFSSRHVCLYPRGELNATVAVDSTTATTTITTTRTRSTINRRRRENTPNYYMSACLTVSLSLSSTTKRSFPFSLSYTASRHRFSRVSLMFSSTSAGNIIPSLSHERLKRIIRKCDMLMSE